MSVKFSTYPTSLVNQNQDQCVVCQENDTTKKWVAHEKMHPSHLECLKLWFQKQAACPTCRAPVELSSVYSLKQRTGAFFSSNQKLLATAILPCMCGITLLGLNQINVLNYNLDPAEESFPIKYLSIVAVVSVSYGIGLALTAFAVEYVGNRLLNSQ